MAPEMKSPMDDGEVKMRIEEVLAGETGSFEPIVTAFTPPLYNLSCKMMGGHEDAPDIVQETFFRAYRDLGKFDGRAPFSSWLYGICINVCYDSGKRRKRSWERESQIDPDSSEMIPDGEKNVEAEVLAGQMAGRLKNCLQKLPETLRSAVLLRYQEDLPLGDVATALKISLSAAKMRVQRGLDMLRSSCDGLSMGGRP